MICKKLEQFSDNLPIILTGDFNSLPLHIKENGNGVYNYITNGSLNKTNPDILSYSDNLYSHNLHLISSFKEKNGFEPEFTNYAINYRSSDLFVGTIDYIFVSKIFNIKETSKIPKLSIIKKKYKSFPTIENSSDHIPISCSLIL